MLSFITDVNLSKQNNRKGIFAKWFSAVLQCVYRDKNNFEIISIYYFIINKGQVQKTEFLTKDEFNKILKIKNKSIANKHLMAKYKMYLHYVFYCSFFLDLTYNDEKITFKNKECIIVRPYNISPLFDY